MPIYNGSTQITTIKRPSYQETSWVNATTAEIQSAVSSGKITTYTAGDGVYTYTAYEIVDTANWRLISQATYQQAVVIQTKRTLTKNEIITWKVGSKYTYCKRSFTVKKDTHYVVVGWNRYIYVYLNEPLPFDITIRFRFQNMEDGAYVSTQDKVLKAGEIYIEAWVFNTLGFWNGYCYILNWYDGREIMISDKTDSPENTKTLY